MDAPPACHILVIDDEHAIRDMLRAALRRGGCEVRTAADGAEALAVLHEWSCDLIITDVNMPRMDGIALLQRLRAQGDATPAVIVSGLANQLTAISLAGLRVRKVLEKPFRMADLLQVVDEVLATDEATM